MICARCQSPIDPALGACPRCGARRESDPARSEEAPWRQQIRETVQRRKEMRRRALAQREQEGRQLSIFPEAAAENEPRDPARERRADIRARVERKLAEIRAAEPPARVVDAGDVPMRRSLSAALAMAPELETSLPELPLVEREEEPELAPDAPALPGELASPGERILAGLMDGVFVSLNLLALVYLATQIVNRPAGDLPATATVAIGCVGFLITAGYFLFFWSLSGQTLGKLLTRSRIVTREGRPLGFRRAVLRGIGVALSILPLGAGFIGLWSDFERRGWHDRLASSWVVRA